MTETQPSESDADAQRADEAIEGAAAANQDAGPAWFQRMSPFVLTLIIVGAVVSAVQAIVLSIAGNTGFDEVPVWSTGGLLALVSAAWIGWKGRSWKAFKRYIRLPVILSIILPVLFIGLMNGYERVVIDQEARDPTPERVYTGRIDLYSSEEQICDPGDDFHSCMVAHAAMYNSLCRGLDLTSYAEETCEQLGDTVDNLIEQDAICGGECLTGGDPGDIWGWGYLEVSPETEIIRNNDGLPEISHQERCYFDLRVIQIGSCLPR